MTLYLQNIICLKNKPNQPISSELDSFFGNDSEERGTKIGGIKHPHT